LFLTVFFLMESHPLEAAGDLKLEVRLERRFATRPIDETGLALAAA